MCYIIVYTILAFDIYSYSNLGSMRLRGINKLGSVEGLHMISGYHDL